MWSAFANGGTLVLLTAYGVVSLLLVGYWAWRSCFPRPAERKKLGLPR